MVAHFAAKKKKTLETLFLSVFKIHQCKYHVNYNSGPLYFAFVNALGTINEQLFYLLN